MTTSYYADRANLYRLERLHPGWTHQQLADALGRSREWVKKWRKRLREEVAAGQPLAQVLQGHSRARKHPPQATNPLVEERILAIRDEPPEGLRRTPGPEAILYYLPRDQEVQAAGVPLPRSSRTIHRIREVAWPHPRASSPSTRAAGAECSSGRLAGRLQRCEQRARRPAGQAATRRRSPQHRR